MNELRYSWTAGQYSYITPLWGMDDPSTSGVTEGFGLMFYNARWYDPYLGRFAQADTIIPGSVQGLDRYAYVNNAPTRFTDPSGHKCVPVEECEGHGYGYSRNKKAAPKIVIFEDYTLSVRSFFDLI